MWVITQIKLKMTKEDQLKFIENNYEAYTNHTSIRRIRHDFFKNIQTEIQAYLLGLYAADGSVDEKRKTFRLHLSKKDSELVYLCKDFISPDARIFKLGEGIVTARDGMKAKRNESLGIDITSTILVQDLVELGYGYRKTYSELSLPNIEKDLIKHFIRGYFDGDGCITGCLIREKGKKDRVRYHINIDGKHKNIFLEMQSWFLENNIKMNLIYLKRDGMYRLNTSSKVEIKKIWDLLFKDATFSLSRKFNKLDYYVNTEVNQLIADHRNAQEMNDKESDNSPTSAEHPTI